MYHHIPQRKLVYLPRQHITFPDIPPDKWCDFRKDFEEGMTMKALGEKYCCDPRTVRKCLLQNRSSQDIGCQTAPTKLTPYLPEINRLFHKYSPAAANLCMLSRQITEDLQSIGYVGSERTVRNHLRSIFYAISDKEEHQNASD